MKRAAVDQLLMSLLRTPKTRAGLAAAVADKGVSEGRVTGWLSRAEARGLVVKAGAVAGKPSFVRAGYEARHPAPPPMYPAWMDPTPKLPEATRRRVYRLGILAGVFDEQQEQEETAHDQGQGQRPEAADRH